MLSFETSPLIAAEGKRPFPFWSKRRPLLKKSHPHEIRFDWQVYSRIGLLAAAFIMGDPKFRGDLAILYASMW